MIIMLKLARQLPINFSMLHVGLKVGISLVDDIPVKLQFFIPLLMAEHHDIFGGVFLGVQICVQTIARRDLQRLDIGAVLVSLVLPKDLHHVVVTGVVWVLNLVVGADDTVTKR
jgi:hypothetical protein